MPKNITVMDRLKALKEMSERGSTPAERETALKMLNKHLEKEGLSLDELDDEVEELFFISIRPKGEDERKLLIQILGVVCNQTTVKFGTVRKRT